MSSPESSGFDGQPRAVSVLGLHLGEEKGDCQFSKVCTHTHVHTHVTVIDETANFKSVTLKSICTLLLFWNGQWIEGHVHLLPCPRFCLFSSSFCIIWNFVGNVDWQHRSSIPYLPRTYKSFHRSVAHSWGSKPWPEHVSTVHTSQVHTWVSTSACWDSHVLDFRVCHPPRGGPLKNQESFSQGSQLRASAPSAHHMFGLSY